MPALRQSGVESEQKTFENKANVVIYSLKKHSWRKWGMCWGTVNALPCVLLREAELETELISRADVEPFGGWGSPKPASFVVSPAAEQLPSPWLRSHQLPVSGSHSWGQWREHGFMSSFSHQLPLTDLTCTWHWDHRNSGWGYMARGLLASLHGTLTPFPIYALCCLSYGLQTYRYMCEVSST